MFNLGMGEITVILVLALIFLGPAKLPDLAAGLGKLIREIRKATSDVKNEIALDDTFRKPFEDLRDAVTLHPDELKRRDQWAKEREEAAKRAADEAAREAAANLAAGTNGGHMPPDGLADDVKIAEPGLPKLPEPNGPNATIVQTSPSRGATLDDIPTPPPEPSKAPIPAVEAAPRPSLFAPMTPPLGTVARPEAARVAQPAPGTLPAAPGTLPAAPGTLPAAPAAAESGSAASRSGVTQILKEEDLMPSLPSGRPPPPPHLPGLRPAGAPRPPAAPLATGKKSSQDKQDK